MKVSISGIYNRNEIANERVHFRADVDLDLSFFVLFDTVFMGGSQVSAGTHTAFWFGPRAIPRGEHIVVYSRTGNPSTERKETGTYHFLFRGSSAPLYSDSNRCAAVMELTTWAATPSNPVVMAPLPPIASSPFYGIAPGIASGLAAGYVNPFGPTGGQTIGALTLAESLGWKPKP
jgi:hypothetical protein